MLKRLTQSTSGISGPGLSAPATPETTAAASPATRVVRDRHLADLISAYANPSARSMPVDTWWRLDTARTAATLRSIHPCFEKPGTAYVNEALARLEHGKLRPETLLTEFMLRLARARLPARYPASEGKRAELARQMTEGMYAHASDQGYKIDIAIALLLDAAYGTPPPPGPAENTRGDPAWAEAIVHVDTLRYCLHTFLSGLATGTHELKKLERLARQCASQTDIERSVWYRKLAFFAAQSGAWRTVKLLLDAEKLDPGALGEPYVVECERIFARISRIRAALVDAVEPPEEGDEEDRIGLLHLAAAQDDVDMLAYLASTGISIDNEDDNGWSALFHAARHGNVRASEWLIKHQTTIDMRSEGESTPLHIAAEHSPAIVRLLIEADADVNAVNWYGQSPLALASHPASVTLLSRAGADLTNTDCSGINILQRWAGPGSELPRLDLMAALHEACTTPVQHERFRQMLNPLQGHTPLWMYLSKNAPFGSTVEVFADAPTLLRAIDETIAGVRLLMAWGADPHHRNTGCESAYDLIRGFTYDRSVVPPAWLSSTDANATTSRAAVDAHLDTLRQLLGRPAVEAAAASQTGKGKRENGA